MMYAVEMASCGKVYVLSFIKKGVVVQAILRFCPSNFSGFNVGITG
jgi:hypothetical protein